MHARGLERSLQLVRRALASIGLVVLAVAGTLLAQHLWAPTPAAGQANEVQEIRAQRFVLVAADGTTLAVLGPGADGNGRLQLLDTTGTQRLTLAGGGALNVFDTDGSTQRFRAGYVPLTDALGRPPINGVWLDPAGAVEVMPPISVQP